MTRHHSNLAALLTLAASLLSTASGACTLVDKRPVRLGTDQGIQGRCANNGESITCTVDNDGEGIDCSGPSGEFSGDNMGNLVRAACGCSASQQDPQNLQQQLDAYP
ncbi:hypothetical protein [Methylotetracoccus oryzae]|uniref:hypothetical protein n=1 Tax=Methylotetracoccus oryzae TaxID=1919059 RepID=UPI00111A42BD|nr:hypothetical protein [Methylotetracoccus oryzae]